MKIAAKIRLSHFVLAAAVLFVGLIGYIAVDQVTRQYDRALRQTMPMIDALQNVRFNAGRVMAIALEPRSGPAAQHEAVEPKEGHEAADGEDSLSGAFAALEAQIHRHRLLAEAYFPDEKAIAETLDLEAARLRAALDQLAVSPVGSSAGDAAMAAVESAVGSITDSVQDALRDEQRELVDYQQAIEILRSATQWTVGGLTLGAFGLALLVAFLAARRLARPIIALRDTTRRFANRDLTARATATGTDEVGELAQAFNEMAEMLGATMVSRDYVENILGQISDGVLVLDEAGRIQRANPAAQALLPACEGGLLGRNAREVLGTVGEPGEAAWPTPGAPVGLVLDLASGTPRYLEVALTELVDHGRPAGKVITLHDVSALKLAENEMRQRVEELAESNRQLSSTQSQLLQSEKMAAIGQLAAGVAHEINNPISFIDANLGVLAKDIADLIKLVEVYATLEPALAADDPRLAALARLKSAADVDYLVRDLPKLIAECRDGAERMRVIVRDLKGFSHADEGEWQWVNLDQCLDSTLNIAWHELKYKARIVKEYGSAPAVRGLPSQLGQVFMNLLVNAGQAITERGTITVRIGNSGGEVWVAIEDTGAGIAPEHLKRIFEPFFTTKPVGKGTGLGLSLAYGIVERHHGRIEVSSQLGKGTVFKVTLPIDATITVSREAQPA